MASGKTTVGRLVAERLQRRFLDLDHLVEETAGMKVADLFRTQGEPAFRKAEAEALHGALHQDNVVLAEAMREKFGGDSLAEIQRNYAAATDRLQARFTTRRS